MKECHVLWTNAAMGNGINADNPIRRLALLRYNIAILGERTGWSPQAIKALDIDEYNDYLLIYKIVDFQRHAKKS